MDKIKKRRRREKGLADTHQHQRRGVWCAMCNLVEPCALLFDVALVTVALQHRLAHCPTAGPAAPRRVLEARLHTVAVLHRGGGRGQVWNR